MSKIDTYVNYAMSVANDNTKGYSQQRRRIAQTQEEVDEIKDGDCSTIVLNGLVLAGIDIANATYTGNMTSALLSAGFQDVTTTVNLRTGTGLFRGDIVIRPKTNKRNGHVAVMIDSERLVQAQYDYDGQVGDSSGKEIRIQKYYDSPFTYVFRLNEDTAQHASSVDPHLFSVTLKQNMNVRSEPNSTSKIITVANKGLGLGIAEISANGNWGRIQNQVSPAQWICITPKYVSRSE